MKSPRRIVAQNTPTVMLYGAAITTFVVGTLVIPGYGSAANINHLILTGAILAIAAAGQTVVMLTGGIDLSIPGMMNVGAITAAVIGQATGFGPRAWLLILGFAVLVGLWNGLGITVLQINPILMTLATNVMLAGILVVAVGSAPPSRAPEILGFFAHGRVLGVPTAVIWLVLCAVGVSLLLSATTFGRRLYAVGAGRVAALYSGIDVRRTTIMAYIFCSVMATIAGWLLLGFVGRGFLDMGRSYQFGSIAAAVVGGVSILGGKGHFIGVIAGVFLLIQAEVLLRISGVGGWATSFVYGAIILFSVLLTQTDVRQLVGGLRRRRMETV